MTDIGSCKTCRYFDSKDWDSETKNWCRYNDLPTTNEGLCRYYEPMIEPCPFCGNDVELKHYLVKNNDWWYIECTTCGIAVDPIKWNSNRSREDTIRIWNRRAKE